MSDALYSTRLRFVEGRGGAAKRHGRVTLIDERQALVLGGNPVHAVDYVPEVRMLEIRRRACDRVESMSDAEIADADAALREFCPSGPAPL